MYTQEKTVIFVRHTSLRYSKYMKNITLRTHRILAILIFSGIGFVLAYYAAHAMLFSSDNAAVILMAKDVLHGNIFLKHWWIPSDNFLTLDVVLLLPFTLIHGVSSLALREAAATSIALVLFAGLYLATLGSKSREDIWLRAIILFGMTGPVSFFFYSSLLNIPTHVVTVFVLLLVFALWERYQRHARTGWILAAAIISALAIFGDPLFVFVGSLPLLILNGIASYKGLDWKSTAAYTVYSQLLAVGVGLWSQGVAIKNGLHLVDVPSQIGDIDSMIIRLKFTITLLLNTFTANFFDHQLYKGATLSLLLDSLKAIALVTLVVVVTRALRTRHKTDSLSSLLALVCVIDFLAYVTSSYVVGLGAERYLFPGIFCGGILVARLLPSYLTSYYMKGAVVALVLLSTYNVQADVVVARKSQDAITNPYPGLAGILEGHHVTNGYATYWNASSVELAAQGNITVEPINWSGTAGVVTPYDWQTKGSNFTQPAQFLIVQDDEVTPETSFYPTLGAPVAKVPYLDFTVYIWNKDISHTVHGGTD